jgi:hypothetical protein
MMGAMEKAFPAIAMVLLVLSAILPAIPVVRAEAEERLPFEEYLPTS